jgi:hypothetical protein
MKLVKSSYGLAVWALFSSTALAADFTVVELHKSSQAATETFRSEYGDALHDSIYGIQVTKGRDSGKVKLFYRQVNEAKSIEYFCHYHNPGELDCHEH